MRLDAIGMPGEPCLSPRKMSLASILLGCLIFSLPVSAQSQEPALDQGTAEMERLMDEARQRQAEMMRQVEQLTGARTALPSGTNAVSNTNIRIDQSNPPRLVLGSLLQDGLQFRSDGRFGLARFKVANLPDVDIDGQPVRYDLPGQERLHVRLIGPDGILLSDHYYTGVEDHQYGGWIADLAIGSPQNIHPEFIRHNAVLHPGRHHLEFLIDDYQLSVFEFTVKRVMYREGPVLQLDGPWSGLMAVSTNNALYQITRPSGETQAGAVHSVIFNRNDRQADAERQGQKYALRILKDGEPFAIYGEILADESRQWEDTSIPWGRGPDGLDVSPSERSHPSWGYNIHTKRSPNTRVGLADFVDGSYTVELEHLASGQSRRYSFTRRGGAFVEGPNATIEAGGQTVWLTPN